MTYDKKHCHVVPLIKTRCNKSPEESCKSPNGICNVPELIKYFYFSVFFSNLIKTAYLIFAIPNIL